MQERGAFESRCFDRLLRPSWSLLPEAINMRKGEGWKDSARHGWKAGISRGQILPRPVSHPCPCYHPWHALSQHPGNPGEVPGSLRPVVGTRSHGSVTTGWALKNKTHNPALGKAVPPVNSSYPSMSPAHTQQAAYPRTSPPSQSWKAHEGTPSPVKDFWPKVRHGTSRAPTTPSVLMSSGHCHQEFSTGPIRTIVECEYKSLFSPTCCDFQTFFNLPRSWGRMSECHLPSEEFYFFISL